MMSTIGFSGVLFLNAPFQVFSNNGRNGSNFGCSDGESSAKRFVANQQQVIMKRGRSVFMESALLQLRSCYNDGTSGMLMEKPHASLVHGRRVGTDPD